jgi:general secretion pathway protein C
MASRLLTFAVWALVLGSAVFWGMKVFAPRTGAPAQAQMPSRSLALGGELRRLLGATAAPADDEPDLADEGGRFQLLGVVAPRGAGASPQGVALIAVGDQPAKAWRTGSVVEGDTVLLAVNQRSVQLGPRGGPATTELTLPEPTAIAGPGGARPPSLNAIPRPVPMLPQGVQPANQNMQQPHGAQAVPRPNQADEDDEE